MARCEDFPCCGHDICPDFDDAGRQVNMRCVCGASVPLSSRSSLCSSCLNAPDPDDPYGDCGYGGGNPDGYDEDEWLDDPDDDGWD